MKKINKIIMLVFALALIATSFQSCKKGEEDPAISLRSRTARLKGKWELVSGLDTYTGSSYSYTVSYNGSTATYSEDGITDTEVYRETLEFKKDNEFSGEIVSGSEMLRYDGYWTFAGAYDDYSKKEIVVIRIKSYRDSEDSETYSGDEMPVVTLRLKRLANKEMIVETKGQSTSGSNVSSYNSLKTYNKK